MTVETRAAAVVLSEEEHNAVALLVERLHGLNVGIDPERFVSEAQLLAAELPERLRRALIAFRRHGSPTGGFFVKNLPTFDVPPTPLDADLAIGSTLSATGVLGLFAAVLGDQFGFKPELSGRIVQDILPVAGFEHTQHSISSRSLLELHCETAFTDARSDYVALFCLRVDPEQQAETILSSVSTWLPLLDPETIAVLRQDRFVTTVDGSFLRGAGIPGPIYIGPIQVLSGLPERPRLRCDFAETCGLDACAQQALDRLYEVASSVAIGIKLQQGDLIFVDNHDAFHGRTPFRFHYDGTDRWLIRSFVTKDLARIAAHRPGDGRIVDIDYSSAEDVYQGDVRLDLTG